MPARKVDKFVIPPAAIEVGAESLKQNPTWQHHARALSATVLSALVANGWTLAPPATNYEDLYDETTEDSFDERTRRWMQTDDEDA